MSANALASHEYNIQVGRLQEALLRQAITRDDYQALKEDLIHPSAVAVDPLDYNQAVTRLQRALLDGAIDRDIYRGLLGDLIRPDKASSLPAAESEAAANVPAALTAGASPPPPPPVSPPTANPVIPSPTISPAAKAGPAQPDAKPALKAVTINDLLERYQEPGVLEQIAQHPQVGNHVPELEQMLQEIERKGDYSPLDLRCIQLLDNLLARLR